MSDKNTDANLKRSNSLARIGLIGSALYIVSVAATIVYCIFAGFILLEPLQVNQVGDFLAGVFGPLAIFWIVPGFFQQGEELHNSVETLKLQARELSLSVEQQRELVMVTKETLDHERMLAEQSAKRERDTRRPKPVLSLKGTMSVGSNVHYDFSAINSGGTATNVSIVVFYDQTKVLDLMSDYWEKGQAIGRTNFRAPGELFVEQLELTLTCAIDGGDKLELRYTLSPPPRGNWGDPFAFRLISETLTDGNG